MKQGFLKFKKRFQIHAIVKSVIFGASVGLLSASALLTILKRQAVRLNPFLYVLIGVAVAAVCGGILYTILRPTDKKLAKKLDKELQLHEKVQTMIAFENESGDILELQRADTDLRLKETPVKSVKTGRIWKHTVMPVLAVAMTVVAAIVPMKEIIPTQAEEPKFELSSWQETRLTELIAEVKASDMEQAPKEEVVVQLEGLLSALKTVDKESVMKQTVIGTITSVKQIEDKYDSYDELGATMLASGQEQVASLASALAKMSSLTAKQELSVLKESIKEETLGEDMQTLERAIDGSVAEAAEEWQSDALYLALTKLADDVGYVYGTMESYTQTWAIMKLDEAFTNAERSIDAALLQQRTNKETAEMAVDELLFIFGISETELPKGENSSVGTGSDEEGEYDPEENDDPLNDGGLGDGEVVYGSNDTIYDYETGAFVSYGEVLDRYFSRATEQKFSGDVPEELQQLIDAYFAKLYNGSK